MRALLCALVVVLPSLVSAAPVTIDFEDLPVDQAIGLAYVARGVTFPNTTIDAQDGHRTMPAPHGGTHIAHRFQPEFNAEPVVMTFPQGIRHVSFFAGSASVAPVVGIARAYDAETGGNLLAQDGPRPLVTQSCATLFDLSDAAPRIKRVELAVQDAGGHLVDIGVDDLSFEGNPPLPTPIDTPIVAITSNSNGQVIDATSEVVTGTVRGTGLPAQVTVSIEHLRGPADLAPGDGATLALAGAGNVRTFSGPIRLPLGAVTITVTAENAGGLRGKASVTLTNLPNLARDTAGGLGALAWALDAPSCKIGVYQNGALATDGIHQFRIEPSVLAKWNAWVGAKWIQNTDRSTFCPRDDLHAAIAPTNAQSFRGGRIYVDPVRGALFAPAVFMHAIDTLGGEPATGVPVDDPVRALAAHTWLLQRFVRTGGMTSTLEIKGQPAMLWVARQGGGLTVGVPLGAGSATVTESFPCTGNEGPCEMAPPAPQPQVTDVAHRFCNDTVFSERPPSGVGTNEWVPITGSHTDAVPLLGWVIYSAPALDDLSTTHEHTVSGGGHVWADWENWVVPLAGYGHLLAGNTWMRVEVEHYFAQHFYVVMDGVPLPGDLYFASGRWIVDCGHDIGPQGRNDSYATEIHPPFLTARMRTVGAPNNRQTEAAIWANGYWRGGNVIELLIYPPPRPAPNAFLTISRTRTQDAAWDVDVIDSAAPDFTDPDNSSFVRARFSASPRRLDIGYAGMLPFKAGREYAGFWNVGWHIEPQFSIGKLGATWWP